MSNTTKIYHRFAEEKLKTWYNSADRKPLILLGARQVGKTTLIRHFASKYASAFYYLDLEDPQVYARFSTFDSVEKIINSLEVIYQQPLKYNGLIFLDEVQNQPHIIKLLRYFKEKYPQYAVVVSGSWLNVYLSQMSRQKSFSFPVGRVEFMTLFPFTFLEYLSAKNPQAYSKLVEDPVKAAESLHEFYMREFVDYLLIGGMPEALRSCNLRPCYKVEKVHNYVLNTIIHDIKNYLPQDPQLTIKIFNTIYSNPGETFSKSKLLPNVSHYLIQKLLYSLEDSFLIYPAKRTYSVKLPITPAPKNATKYLALDTGLTLSFNGLFKGFLELADNFAELFEVMDTTHKGKLMEQVAGQLLLPTFYPTYLPRINNMYYWQNQGGKAEIDFLLQHKHYLVGVEVKSGKVGKLRSLINFLNTAKYSIGVRIYAGPLRLERISLSPKPIISVPFYLVEFLPQLFNIYKLDR